MNRSHLSRKDDGNTSPRNMSNTEKENGETDQEKEIRRRNPFWKTKECRFFLQGRCRHAADESKCSFIHPKTSKKGKVAEVDSKEAPAASKTSKKEKVAEVDNKEAPNAESLLSIRKEVDFLEERLKKIRRYTIKPKAQQ